MGETLSEKKLSAKTILGDVARIKNQMIKDDVKRKDFYAIYGVAHAVESGMGKHGEWFALVGEFEAVNLMTGETFSAFKAFLPRDITNYFAVGLRGSPGAVANFNVVIGIKLTDTTIGYEYTVTPKTPLKQSAALAAMRDEAKKYLPDMIKANKALPTAAESKK